MENLKGLQTKYANILSMEVALKMRIANFPIHRKNNLELLQIVEMELVAVIWPWARAVSFTEVLEYSNHAMRNQQAKQIKIVGNILKNGAISKKTVTEFQIVPSAIMRRIFQS